MELLRVAALGFRLAGILVCRKGARVVCTVGAKVTVRCGSRAYGWFGCSLNLM